MGEQTPKVDVVRDSAKAEGVTSKAEESTERRERQHGGAPDADDEARRQWWQRPIQDALRGTWDEARQARAGFERELRRRFRQVLDVSGVGQGTDSRGAKEVQRLLGELRERLQKSREDVEQRVQESARSAVERVRQPIADELAVLRERADHLTKRLTDLLSGDPDVDGKMLPTRAEPEGPDDPGTTDLGDTPGADR